MRYKIVEINGIIQDEKCVVVSISEDSALSVPVQQGNISYIDFLTSAKLTDEEVHALEPDVWYDFPTNGGKK